MRSRISLPCATLALTCLAVSALGSARDLQAQTVRGRLIDNETRRPVINGTVSLFNDSLGVTVAWNLTDSEGRFTLEAPRPGRYTLSGTGLGYRGGINPRIQLGEGEDLTMDLYLLPDPLELDPLEVSAERVRSEPERQGFFRRREQGRGFFLTPSQLKLHPPITEAELVARAPFVYLDRALRWDGAVPKMRSFGEECVPAVLVDDIQVPVGRPAGIREPPPTLEEYVNFADITALEVYRGLGEIPRELALPFEDCGVIMIWTVWSEVRSRRR